MSWQPIETAPHDMPVLVSVPGRGVFSAINVEAYGTRQWRTNADLFECFYPQIQGDPSHWMPIPEPPHVA